MRDVNCNLVERWIEGSSNRQQFWAQCLIGSRVRTMVEIGVWKGDFACSILHACPEIARYVMVDPWANLANWDKPANVSSVQFEAIYNEAMQKTAFAAEKIAVLRGRTQDVFDKIPEASLDFAYIDGDHTLRGVTVDLVRATRAVREGGLVGGDDFAPNPWHHGSRYEPTLVFPFAIHFAEAMGYPCFALPFNQFLIHKNPAAGFSFVDLTQGRYTATALNSLLLSDRQYWKHLGRRLKARLFSR